MYKKSGWIGVDFDGTLSHYDKWRGPFHFGEPIMPMVEQIRKVLDMGYEVRIFTARVSSVGEIDKLEVIEAIQDWLQEKCALPRLNVTCVKDFQCIEIWDDRAMHVPHNSGQLVGKSRIFKV